MLPLTWGWIRAQWRVTVLASETPYVQAGATQTVLTPQVEG